VPLSLTTPIIYAHIIYMLVMSHHARRAVIIAHRRANGK
jgi:hypothetical protein